MTPIHFVARIVPRAKGRPRVYRVGGRMVATTPESTRRWEAAFAAIAEQHAPPAPLDEPLEVDLLFVLPRPQRLMRKGDLAGLIHAPGKPDADNLAKAALDAMRGFWRDDARIVSLRARKAYAEMSGMPRVEVIVRPASSIEQEPCSVCGGGGNPPGPYTCRHDRRRILHAAPTPQAPAQAVPRRKRPVHDSAASVVPAKRRARAGAKAAGPVVATVSGGGAMKLCGNCKGLAYFCCQCGGAGKP